MSSLSVTDSEDDDPKLLQKFRIRLNAANLPVKLFQKPPSTFAVVTTTSSPSAVPPRHNREGSMVSTSSGVSNLSESSNSTSIWGKTEVVHNNRHPTFTQSIMLNYVTGSNTFFYVHLFQRSDNRKMDMHSFGTALFHVNDFVSTNVRVKRLRSGGVLFCRLEPVWDETKLLCTVSLHFRVIGLVQKKLQKAPNTVLELAKRSERGWLVVFRSAVVRRSTEPIFDPIVLDLESLCGSDMQRSLRISVYSEHHKKRKLIGISETNSEHLLQFAKRTGVDDDLTDPEDDGLSVPPDYSNPPQLALILQEVTPPNKEVGTVQLLQSLIRSKESVRDLLANNDSVRSEPAELINYTVDLAQLTPMQPLQKKSFSEYMQGTQLDMLVAIDFTSSNGNPHHEDSNHYLFEGMNDYEETISAIGTSISKYSNEVYTVWGFGANFGGQVRHLFQVGPTSTVNGVEGILEAYRSVFENDLYMSGPTIFSSILKAAGARAKKSSAYVVLLVITDGIMTDFDDTKTILDLCSGFPLSVVFVGVGRADFGNMYRLCSQTSNTTFVEFRRLQQNPLALGEAALRNIPAQLCRYMQSQAR